MKLLLKTLEEAKKLSVGENKHGFVVECNPENELAERFTVKKEYEPYFGTEVSVRPVLQKDGTEKYEMIDEDGFRLWPVTLNKLVYIPDVLVVK